MNELAKCALAHTTTTTQHTPEYIYKTKTKTRITTDLKWQQQLTHTAAEAKVGKPEPPF